MELASLVNSRFQLLSAPVASPGKCTVCGSSEIGDREYIDFGFQLDWYGAIYLCTICLTEAGSVIGLVDPKSLNEIISSLNEDCGTWRDRATEAREELGAARLLLRNCHCSDSDSGFICIDPNAVVSEGSESVAGDSSDNDESSSVEGIVDVPQPPSDEFSRPAKRTRKPSTGE